MVKEKEAKPKKSLEEVRADARQRKRNQRERDSVFEEELKLKSMDPGERRVRKLMAQIAVEPRKPQPLTAPGPPQPARLPTLAEWHKCLKTIHSQAAAEEIGRVEAAIAAGLTEFPQEGWRTYE